MHAVTFFVFFLHLRGHSPVTGLTVSLQCCFVHIITVYYSVDIHKVNTALSESLFTVLTESESRVLEQLLTADE